MDADLLKQIVQGGFGVALLLLIYFVGMRLIRAVDELGKKVDSHTTKDVEAHGEVREAVIDLRARFDVIHDLTPVEGTKRRTNPRGVPVGEYGFHRPKTSGDDR